MGGRGALAAWFGGDFDEQTYSKSVDETVLGELAPSWMRARDDGRYFSLPCFLCV